MAKSSEKKRVHILMWGSYSMDPASPVFLNQLSRTLLERQKPFAVCKESYDRGWEYLNSLTFIAEKNERRDQKAYFGNRHSRLPTHARAIIPEEDYDRIYKTMNDLWGISSIASGGDRAAEEYIAMEAIKEWIRWAKETLNYEEFYEEKQRCRFFPLNYDHAFYCWDYPRLGKDYNPANTYMVTGKENYIAEICEVLLRQIAEKQFEGVALCILPIEHTRLFAQILHEKLTGKRLMFQKEKLKDTDISYDIVEIASHYVPPSVRERVQAHALGHKNLTITPHLFEVEEDLTTGNFLHHGWESYSESMIASLDAPSEPKTVTPPHAATEEAAEEAAPAPSSSITEPSASQPTSGKQTKHKRRGRKK